MSKFRFSPRIAALAGLAVVTASTLVVTLVGPAVAASPRLTSCTEQVRVRSQPSTSAPVIGSCKAGEQVTVDETRNGFAHLVNKKGWASADYVKLGNNSSSRGENSDDNNSSNGDDNNSDNGDDNSSDGGSDDNGDDSGNDDGGDDSSDSGSSSGGMLGGL
ncbi:MAG TPA: SH3 domain-containing protein [Pseudonocardia sp.]|jgi:hypothetical protein|uniref:SH3 domain-containing protein n=1 Tax=Pseudonocardia sp. TaxID=60912 RepID=UPI002C2641C4|nr:SH3 domain-containing protein [Pseudonocardia sp.]HTF49947.1 SH3 domain-containing protein [Pseudonocardia sp.]